MLATDNTMNSKQKGIIPTKNGLHAHGETNVYCTQQAAKMYSKGF
jgi:hypothetical protein